MTIRGDVECNSKAFWLEFFNSFSYEEKEKRYVQNISQLVFFNGNTGKNQKVSIM